jgi:uncharacterized OB-fold protein
MSGDGANVVKMWRGRGEMLGRQGFRCTGCGAVSLVRRRLCARCGAGAATERTGLSGGEVRAVTAAGLTVENLDQVTGRKAAVWIELSGGAGHLACLLQHSDSLSLLPHLRGAPVRLCVRRVPLGPLPPGEPIPYALKAALDLRTRLAHKPKPETTTAQKTPSK